MEPPDPVQEPEPEPEKGASPPSPRTPPEAVAAAEAAEKAVAAAEVAALWLRRKEIVREEVEEVYRLMTVKELRGHLRKLNLPVSGLKADLVARLMRAWPGEEYGSAEETASVHQCVEEAA